ncbi:hypothetical protein Droror1_Dr00026536 [Drosera rotundifolia]
MEWPKITPFVLHSFASGPKAQKTNVPTTGKKTLKIMRFILTNVPKAEEKVYLSLPRQISLVVLGVLLVWVVRGCEWLNRMAKLEISRVVGGGVLIGGVGLSVG